MLKCRDCGNTEDFVREKLMSIWNDGIHEQDVEASTNVIRCDKCNSLNVDVDYPEPCKKYIITTKQEVWAKNLEHARELLGKTISITKIVEVKE